MAEDNQPQESDCAFQWDEDSHLYYHASTGFYHDPQAGWYYSSIDGLYYKFEDGNYIPLESNQDQVETSDAQIEVKEVHIDPSLDSPTNASIDQSDFPPPPSEWLEDTLIDLYLSGYSNRTNCGDDSDMTMAAASNCADELNGDEDIEELEEGEWVPDDPDFWRNFSDKILAEGVTEEEENWRAQYGQVSQLDKERISSDLQTVDLWDWGLVKGTKKDGQSEIARLVGKLRKPSTKLHPSVSSGGGIFKTAPVCEVHLDMVRVKSGRIYRLKNPSRQYLASLSVYDAYNPTRDWGFPQLSIKDSDKLPELDEHLSESRISEVLPVRNEKSLQPVKICISKKDHNVYRDRAAERRALHGGFGVGPGQKNSILGPDYATSSPTLQPEEAAAESLNISFGEGSYARKILQGMGWKEGETLGLSMKGLSEPIQANGNKGTAGLGWDNGWKK
ncbi:hypothetical protein ACP275_09G018100 [Erythranthe tilingii]